MCVTCVRVWLSPALRSVEACVDLLAIRVLIIHISCILAGLLSVLAKTAPSARDVAVSGSTAVSRSATALSVPAVPATTRQRSARPVRRHVRGADREGAGAALC